MKIWSITKSQGRNTMEYTWEQFDEDVKKIIEWILSRKEVFDNIYGVPKGGLVLAVKLCNMLYLPLILEVRKITKKTLVVDDISDSGKTLELFRKKGNTIITIFFHKQTTVYPDFCLREKIGDNWVNFPWDNSEKKYRDGTKVYL